MTKQCRDCKQTFSNLAELMTHKKAAHNWTPKTKLQTPTDPLERFNEIQRSIHAIIRDLEFERQKHHDKILEIDNIICRYKKSSLLNRE